MFQSYPLCSCPHRACICNTRLWSIVAAVSVFRKGGLNKFGFITFLFSWMPFNFKRCLKLHVYIQGAPSPFTKTFQKWILITTWHTSKFLQTSDLIILCLAGKTSACTSSDFWNKIWAITYSLNWWISNTSNTERNEN